MSTKSRKQYLILAAATAAAAALSALAPIRALAADQASEAAAPATPVQSSSNEDKAERIEVTGSHIKRIDVEGVAPVETVTHQEIEQKGYDSLGAVVRDLGANTFGSSTVISGNSTAPGASDINLRGLGADNTLVLLNGQRLPQDAITGTVDINLVPIAAVDRIEILKDGASAIYGSDALGGVVNIITRRDFQGTEVAATQSLPTSYSDGKQTKASLVNGINTEKLSVVTSLGYRYDQAVNSRNRAWSNNNVSSIGSPGAYASIDPTTGQDGTWYASQNCPAGLVKVTPAGTFCQFKYSDYSEEAPLINQIGALSEAHYEASSDVRLTARANYIHRDAQTIAAPSPASPGQIVVPAATVASKFPGLPNYVPGDDIDLATRLTALGTRNTDVTTNSYGGLAGATIQLPHDWQLDVTGTYTLVSSHLAGTGGFALASTVLQAIQAGAYNPFAAAGQQGDLSSAAYVPTEDTQSLLTGFEVKASGDLFDVAAGPVGMAIGTLVNFSSYSDATDAQTLAGNVLGNAGSSGAGHRTAEAVYSELSIPLLEKTLELQLAARFDHYSDFGSTTNPKIGFLYHASKSLLFRGSVGTGFRAPLLTELYAGQSVGYPSFIDYVACAKYPGSPYCQAQQYQVTSGGNPGLKQETSVSYTVGAIYEPAPGFNLGADLFLTQIANMPGIDYNDMTLAQQNGVDPTKYGVVITRDSSGVIQSVVAPLQNLSSEQVAGVDITGTYAFGRFKLTTEQNQMFYYKLEGFPGSGLVDKLGWNGNPSWRNTSSIAFLPASRQELTLTSHSIPRQKTLDKSGYISPLTTLDLAYTYRTKSLGDFSLGVINLLNSDPPRDPSNPNNQVNYALYDPNGRQVVLGYRKAL